MYKAVATVDGLESAIDGVTTWTRDVYIVETCVLVQIGKVLTNGVVNVMFVNWVHKQMQMYNAVATVDGSEGAIDLITTCY